MVTKFKKWSPAVSFAAFFLGVSLTLGGISSVLSVMDWDTSYNVRQKDYRDTQMFQDAICGYVWDFIAMGTGDAMNARNCSIYARIQNADFGEYTFDAAVAVEQSAVAVEQSAVTEAEKSYAAETNYTGNDMGQRIYDTEKDRKNAQRLFKNDKNVLYSIAFQNQVVYSNTNALSSNMLYGYRPQGYDFLLEYDGKRVTIIKDGEEIDIYGDGFYREGGWFLPGFSNMPVPNNYQDVTVVMAVKNDPVYYSDYNGKASPSVMYNLAEQWALSKGWVKTNAALIFCGLVLLMLSQFMRKSRRRAAGCIALWTGRLWFECKLLILLLATGIFLLDPYGISELFYRLQWEPYIPLDMLLSYIKIPFYHTGKLLFLFWICCFFINDLRRNDAVWKHSLKAKYSAVLKTAELRLPMQKRMVARYRNAVLAEAGLAVLAIISVTWLVFCMTRWFDRQGTAAFLMILLAAALYAGGFIQWRAAKENRKMAEDLAALTGHIAMIRGGNLAVPLVLPNGADLAEAARDLNDIQSGMHKAMEEQMKSERMKVELITNVSHDLKTPLTSIISYIELLRQEESLPEHVKDYIRILQNKSERLKTMVQDVVEVSKAASGQLPVQAEILDLAKLLRQTLADMAEQIAAAPVSIRTDIPQEPVYIQADGQRLYRVFQNLIQNALQYSLSGSRIYVTLKTADGRTVANVKNTSAMELPDNVDFAARFVRGDESRTDGGSGLGLSIANSFTEACGGRFSIETQADLFMAAVELPMEPCDTSAKNMADPDC